MFLALTEAQFYATSAPPPRTPHAAFASLALIQFLFLFLIPDAVFSTLFSLLPPLFTLFSVSVLCLFVLFIGLVVWRRRLNAACSTRILNTL